MKKNFIFFIYLTLTLVFLFSNQLQANEKCKQWKADWSSCNANSDCVVVSNPCGWPTSVSNKRSSEEASKCNRLEGAAISCPVWNSKTESKRIAVCVSGKCQNNPEVNILEKHTLNSEDECKKQGGRWEGSDMGRGRLTGCNMKTEDGGKFCKRGEDCQSVCLKDYTCYGWQMYKGCAGYKGDEGILCVE
jgi:hypothetical protein